MNANNIVQPPTAFWDIKSSRYQFKENKYFIKKKRTFRKMQNESLYFTEEKKNLIVVK